VTLTDYDIHAMWIQPGVDHYFVATEEMAYALREKGIEETAVSVSGIPIPPVFAEPRPERAAVRQRLGLPADATVVLVSAGGAGLARIDRVVSLLADRFETAQFLAVAGSNRRLQRALRRVADAYPENVRAYGFVDNMHELMAAADLAVTKCGGLTSSECMSMGLPMVIVRPIPGQEERNADYLLENGVALRGRTHAQTLFKAETLLMDPVRMEEMARASHRLARPNAAYEIAALVMERLSGASAAERSIPAPGQAGSVSSLGPAASISS
jgi:processive 1,2-diacylglycerol beta-glucosyltransferase